MSYNDEYLKWLSCDVLNEYQKTELKVLDEKEKKARFHGYLEFGTAGLRGKMGMGTAMMNEYVIRHATQSFAEVILEEVKDSEACVCICHDCRINSRLLPKRQPVLWRQTGYMCAFLKICVLHRNCPLLCVITALLPG